MGAFNASGAASGAAAGAAFGPVGAVAGAALGGFGGALGGGGGAAEAPTGPRNFSNSANFGSSNYRSGALNEGSRTAESSAKQNDPATFAGAAQDLAASPQKWIWPVVAIVGFVTVLFLILKKRKA